MLTSTLRFFTTALLLLFVAGATAQEDAAIQFEETTHQFGNIEQGKPVTHVFTFTNTSDAPVKLSNVRASCGCTTPDWTREEVAPGATGEIKVRYNAAAMGNFTKTVTVQYEGGERPVILYIKGKVEADGNSEDQLYSNKVGDLGFDRLAHNLGVLNSDQTQTINFKVKNLGTTPITLQQPAHEMMLAVSYGKATLAPGEKTEVSVTADGEKFMAPGAFTKTVRIPTSMESTGEITLTLVGNLNKVFSAEELASMPNIEFAQTTYNAGTVIEGEKVEVKYAFTNTGKSDLIIESVKASCGCTASAPKDTVIPPGESSEILASFDSRGRQGAQNKSITVRSNDPDQGTIILRFMVEVERDPFHVGGGAPANGGQ